MTAPQAGERVRVVTCCVGQDGHVGREGVVEYVQGGLVSVDFSDSPVWTGCIATSVERVESEQP